ncbi:hypothetical protein LCGC14_1552200, partial [marine sediment metagenome]
GLNPIDLGVTTDAVEIHQDLFHSNGVLKTSNANIFEAIINVNTSPHSLDINPPIGGDVFYINGVEYNGISNTVVTWTDVTIAGTPTSQGLYDIYALEGSNGIASIVKERRAEYNRDSFEENAAVNNYLADNVQLRSVSKNFEATNLNLRYLADESLAIEYPTGSGYGTKEFLPDDNLPDVIRLYNATREYWIEVYAIDQGSKTAQFTSNENEVINIFALPDQEARLLIASVVFSGTGTSNLEYLGGGFTGGLHKPNTLVDYGQIDLIKIDNTISGIRVLSISRNVPEGIGSLEFTLTGTLLAWGAPGESAGTGVDVSSGGVGYPIFEISSTTPEYILKVQSYNADLPGSNQTDIFEIKTDETYFGIVGRDDLRGDVDSFLRDLEVSKQGKYKRTLFKTVEDRLFASSFIVTVGTGYGVSIGDYNVKDFDDAATCINRATSDLRFSSENGGGIISIKSGTYIFDTASVILLHDKISLIGEHKNAVIFTKNTSTNQIINSITSHNTIKNITFTLDGSIGITTLLDFDNSHVKIIDCDFIVNVQPSAIVTIIVLTASANYTTIRDCTFTIDGAVTQNVGLINFASAAVRIQDCTFDGNTDEPVIIGSASTADSARIVINDFINIDNGSLGDSPISIQGSYCHILHNNMLGTGSVQAITVTSSGTYNIITNNYVSGLRIGISAGGPSNIVHSNIFLNCQFGGMLFDEGGCIAANNIILGTATSYGISATSNASKTIVNGNRIDSIGSTATAIDMNGADKIISNNKIDVDEHGIEASREGTIISSNLVDSLDRGIYIEANTAIDLTAVVIGNVCVNQDSIASQTGAITFLRSNTGARINGTIIGNVTLSPLDGIFIEQTGGTTTLEDAVVVVGNSIITTDGNFCINVDSDMANSAITGNVGVSLTSGGTGIQGSNTSVITGNSMTVDGDCYTGKVVTGNIGISKEESASRYMFGEIVVGNFCTGNNAPSGSYGIIGIEFLHVALGNRVENIGLITTGTVKGIAIPGGIDNEEHVIVGNTLDEIGNSSATYTAAIFGATPTATGTEGQIIVANCIGRGILSTTPTNEIGIDISSTNAESQTTCALNSIMQTGGGASEHHKTTNPANLFPDHSVATGPDWGSGGGEVDNTP